jgi:hypothetical protein
MSAAGIIAMAEQAVTEKRKNWRGIAAKLQALGYTI